MKTCHLKSHKFCLFFFNNKSGLRPYNNITLKAFFFILQIHSFKKLYLKFSRPFTKYGKCFKELLLCKTH